MHWARYLQIVAMRTLAVVLWAWPGAIGALQLYVTGDFFWLALAGGAPLLALSLWLSAQQLLDAQRPARWHVHPLAGDAEWQALRDAERLRAAIAADVGQICEIPWQDLPRKVA